MFVDILVSIFVVNMQINNTYKRMEEGLFQTPVRMGVKVQDCGHGQQLLYVQQADE